jgi:hypothetical protein
MVMTLSTCLDRCKCARLCARHSINRPDPRVRTQRFEKFEPKLEKDCRGFIDLDDDDTTTYKAS